MIAFVGDMFLWMMKYIRPDEILSGKIKYNRIPLNRLKKIGFAVNDDISETALDKKLEYLCSWVFTELSENGRKTDLRQDNRSSDAIAWLDLLNCLSDKILTIEHSEVVFKYEEMKVWHRISGKLGSELFVANAYAFNDYKYAIHRKRFLWKEVLDHDNYELDHILAKGVSDNHYHLRGSTPYFDLSWISLMNSLTDTEIIKRLDQLQSQERSIETRYKGERGSESYNLLHLKAALIRIYLYSLLVDRKISLKEYKVSPEWLLEQIFRTEPVEQYVRCNLQDRTDNELLCECMERDMSSSDEMKDNLFEKMRLQCRGFYWFFWELYGDIPIGVLPRRNILFCEENMTAMIEYIKACHESVPLTACEWLFGGERMKEYDKEWEQQTRNAVFHLLADPYDLMASRHQIQSVIDSFQNYHALECKDYMLNESGSWNSDDWENAMFSGEHWFVYHMIYDSHYNMMAHIYNQDDVLDLFFVYMLIKEAFRMELLQCNDKIGFENFQAYQRRKNWFTTKFSEGELAAIAVKTAFQNPSLNSLELRIMPGKCSADNIRTIQRYDREILEHLDEQKANAYYYVFHFRKQRDAEVQKDSYLIRYRHEKFRKDLRTRTNAILFLREKNCEIGQRVLGVDACSGEDGCRPEVFATAFRVLKNHQVKNLKQKDVVPQLHISYHVGEENQDVLDGLRAIDEAITFLNMGSGDRLGHATMLGVDVMEWYYRNHYQVAIRQLDYLDNVVWLYQKMVEYHIPNENNLLEYLETEFQKYFEKIFHSRQLGKEYNSIDNQDFHIQHYYTAWEMRGDDPELYRTGRYVKVSCPHSIWDDNLINKQVDKEKRKELKATALLHAYHYSARVRIAGNESIVVNIPIHMVRGILAVQRKMRKKIAQKGIAIETNPTSNVLIGGLGSYARHPITAFYNKGLTNDTDLLNECPQINVSINTDDLGVFTTSLNNEYALMVNSLETIRDQEGNKLYKKDMVYDWIDNIRVMGNSQSFNH